MKKLHLFTALAYLFVNLLFASSFVSPLPAHNKPFCGPYEFKITNPSGYPVTRVTLTYDGPGTAQSWVYNSPSFPIIVPGAPFENGDYTVRFTISGDYTGSVRVRDNNSYEVIACETFFNHLIPPLPFTPTCSWYELQLTNITSCP